MASLSCRACGVSKSAPSCPNCSQEDAQVALIELNSRAVCPSCAHSQSLPKHCGWEMTISA